MLLLHAHRRALLQGAQWQSNTLSFRDGAERPAEFVTHKLKNVKKDIQTLILNKTPLTEIESVYPERQKTGKVIILKELKGNTLKFDTFWFDSLVSSSVMNIRELSYYEMVSLDELASIRKMRERRIFHVKGKQLVLFDRLGSGGIGVVYSGNYDAHPVVVKFFNIHNGSKKQDSFLKSNQTIHKLCSPSPCPDFVHILEAGPITQKFSDLSRSALILERGSSNASDYLQELFENRAIDKLGPFISSLVATADRAFQFLRSKNLCHSDADLSNFLLVENRVKISDFDLISSRDGKAYTLEQETLGKYPFPPPELDSGRFICSTGYDEFYFAYSLILNLAKHLKIPIKHFRAAQGSEPFNKVERIKKYKTKTSPLIEKVLKHLEKTYEDSLKSNSSKNNHSTKRLKDAIKRISTMLSTNPEERELWLNKKN